MDVIFEKDRVHNKLEEMIELGRERINTPTPEVMHQSAKALEMIKLAGRKGAMNDKKRYDRARQAFEQNFEKLNP